MSRLRKVTHSPDIAKPEVAWDDLIQINEIDEHWNGRHGYAFVTAEFMRDAMNPLITVVDLIDEKMDDGPGGSGGAG